MIRLCNRRRSYVWSHHEVHRPVLLYVWNVPRDMFQYNWSFTNTLCEFFCVVAGDMLIVGSWINPTIIIFFLNLCGTRWSYAGILEWGRAANKIEINIPWLPCKYALWARSWAPSGSTPVQGKRQLYQ